MKKEKLTPSQHRIQSLERKIRKEREKAYKGIEKKSSILDRWKTKIGILTRPDGSMEAHSYQSQWPDCDGSRNLYWYYREVHGVVFSFYALAKEKTESGITFLSLQKEERNLTKHVLRSLPNINGLKYACSGDFGVSFTDNAATKRIRSFIDYCGAPNLREAFSIEATYIVALVLNQGVALRMLKEDGSEMLKSPQELWAEAPGSEELREHVCYMCGSADESSYAKSPEYSEKFFIAFAKNYPKLVPALSNGMFSVPCTSCLSCVFRTTDSKLATAIVKVKEVLCIKE